MPDGLTVAIAAIISISAPLAGWLAHRRERPPAVWFILGALGGPFAIAVLLLAPPGACPRCDSVVSGWPASCATCGRRFRVVAGGSAPPRPAQAPAGEPPAPAATVTAVAGPQPARPSRRPRAVGPGRPRTDRPATLAERTMRTTAASRRTRPASATADAERAATPGGADALPAIEATRADTAPPADIAPPPPADTASPPADTAPRPADTAPPADTPPPRGPSWTIPGVQDLGGRLPSGRERHEDERVAPRATDVAEPATLVIVASGVFTGGSAGLEIGSRYGIGREGHHLVVLGPVDRTPNEVRVTMPLDGIDVLSIDDRVTVASRAGRHDRLAMAFIRAAGLRGTALEEAIADVKAAATNGERQ